MVEVWRNYKVGSLLTHDRKEVVADEILYHSTLNCHI